MDRRPPSDEEIQRRMQELGEKALAELRRRGLTEDEIQKFLARKKPRRKNEMLPRFASPADNTNDVMTRLKPVWLNTFWIKNALDLCEGIWQHADDLPAQNHHFFALVEKFSVDAVVVGICKLFDRSNPHYDKDTIPELMNYARTHLTDAYVARLDARVLIRLGVGDGEASNIVTGYKTRSALEQTRDTLFNLLDDFMPSKKPSSPLEQLFLFRDKVVAHQERVGCALAAQLKHLPCVDDMEKINNWASDFCELISCIMTNETLMPHAVSARMAALHVVAKVLDKKFDSATDGASYQEQEAFFRRPAAWVK
jgi:hypothetical protein